ncbi:MAG: vWA domain-containing protein [Pirellulaceae bacterium]
MLRTHQTLALCGLFGFALFIAGCGGGGVASKPAVVRSGEAAKTTAADASMAPQRYAESSPAEAMMKMSPSRESHTTAESKAEVAANGSYSTPASALPGAGMPAGGPHPLQDHPTEGIGPGEAGDKFAYTQENVFLNVKDTPLSTFSIDVDTASYSKTRAYLLQHHSLPPADAVRIEEMVNYFDYSYSPPTDNHPFAVHIETAACPWQPQHRLVRFGIQGKKIDSQRPSSNLVFLLDVSGSMNQPNKLPLVIYGMKMLVNQLGENDRVSMVVYAGAAGMILPPTSGEDHQRIISALEQLHAGGSTNGGQGIHLAYQLAEQNFIKGGVNRVILCSDGDFNVGTTSTGDLVRLAVDKSKSGVFLSVLGFGNGNHNDEMLEQIADKANGNYAFIDSEAEARKVLVEQLSGTLVTIAKDVKIQVEFNPAQVASYRLIGYENRKLADRDFNDDKKDAGEIGAGHSVTVLYEIVPPGAEPVAPEVDPLKYQKKGEATAPVKEGQTDLAKTKFMDELLTLKMRYQPPAGGQSTLLTFPVKDSQAKFGAASQDFQFATAVASFGMLLRNSQFKGDTSFAAVLETAAASKGEDKYGYRAEFMELVKAAQRLSGKGDDVIPADWKAGRTATAINMSYQAPRCLVEPQPAIFSGFTIAPLALGIMVGVGACLIALAVVFALNSIWNYSPAPRHMAGIPPLPKVKG